MEPRFNMMENEVGAQFPKRFAAASLVIAQLRLGDRKVLPDSAGTSFPPARTWAPMVMARR